MKNRTFIFEKTCDILHKNNTRTYSLKILYTGIRNSFVLFVKFVSDLAFGHWLLAVGKTCVIYTP